MADYKFDIFKVLDHISTRNQAFFDKLSDDDLKDIHPLVLMRWLTGTSDKRQVFFINTLANPYIFSLTKHKRLLLKLLMTSCSGKSQRYAWNKQLSKAGASKPISTRVVCEYFGYSKRDADDALKLLQKQDILSMAEDLGYQHEDMLKLRREHKDDGDKEKPKTKSSKTGGFEL